MEQQNYSPHGGMNQPDGGQGKGMAIASLVLGILSVLDPTFIFGIIMGIVGIVLAVMAKKKGYIGGMATAGMVLSIIGVALNGIMLLLFGAALFTLGGLTEILAEIENW
ncbi:MAG: DUF4190 domain-containing protein [Oscillospiraceae bacterium]|nr:DUF4190 domain-containing protein [Oscillospiraceae bacterium]MCL2227806.1 DUF4190 domain-containing protein [Oscillospiraceae bacterium]